MFSAETKFFDAHNHLQNYPGLKETQAALKQASSAGVKLMLCNATRPADWKKVLDLTFGHTGILACFGLHPWFVDEAGEGWLWELEGFLQRAPSGVGEIGIDGTVGKDNGRQEEIFRAQLRLAKKLERPISIHCVKAWGRLLSILKEEKPSVFMLHAYGGPSEMVEELAGLGAYFSFDGGIRNSGREKMRRALVVVPPKRLLFETGAPEPGAAGPGALPEVLGCAAAVLGLSPGSLGELSWNNAKVFLGNIFPAGF
jgi:TatD DNase family protein